MGPKQAALVTGANKGIGLAVARGLARGYPDLTVLVGARDPGRGHAAVRQLQGEGLPNVEFISLDVTDTISINAARDLIDRRFSGLSVLVNNAGIAWPGQELNEEIARRTIATNYYGVVHVTMALWNLVKRAHGAIVNISSTMGARALSFLAKPLQDQFLDPKLTLDGLHALMERFVADVASGEYRTNGWPANSYGVSKAGVSMFTRIMARDNAADGVVINCCCPGWVKTDMTGPHAILTPDEGARTPLKLAALRAETADPSGLFWYREEPRDWLYSDH